MATDTTTVNPTQTRFSYAGIPAIPADLSPVPRGEIRCYATGGIAAPGAGDNQQFVINIDLPVNSAYAVADYAVRLLSGDANFNFPASLLGAFTNDVAAATVNVPIDMRSSAEFSTVGLAGRIYTPVRVPTIVMLPATAQSQVQLHSSAYNTTADDVPYSYVIFARLLEFAIEQSHRWEVNTPQLIR